MSVPGSQSPVGRNGVVLKSGGLSEKKTPSEAALHSPRTALPHGSADPEPGFGGAEGTRAEVSDSPPDLWLFYGCSYMSHLSGNNRR